MNPTDQIRAIAELDGWKFVPSHDSSLTGRAIPEHWVNDDEYDKIWVESAFPKYLTSYDAIIPVIQKQFIHIYQWLDFERSLALVLGVCTTILYGRDALKATPAQLCEALLRATGKWTE